MLEEASGLPVVIGNGAHKIGAPGQLEMELDHGVWRVSPADGYVSEENVEQLWNDLQESGPVISL